MVDGRVEGDGAVLLSELAPLDRAGPGALTFLLAPRYHTAFRASRAGAALVSEAASAPPAGPATRILVREVHAALATMAANFAPERPTPSGSDPAARIDPSAEIGPEGYVGPFAVIGERARLGRRVRVEAGAWIGPEVVIGDDCHIGPNAVCYSGTAMGRGVRLKAGAVVGGPGFGFGPGAGGHRRMPHLGGCRLEDDVEIGSGSCVDRGSFDDTVIGRGTKIDNLVQVGHNVRIGERCLVMATTGIAGSCRIGNDVVIAGGVGMADHAIIGDGAVLSAKCVVFGPGEVPAGAVVGGYPARPHRAFLRAQAALYRLAPAAGALEALVRERRHDAQTDRRPPR